ncbi:MAG: galactokinase [Erysipelotrichaceae bacterium]|nr:galactokinase [Erysipelotrichaceae bacterium]
MNYTELKEYILGGSIDALLRTIKRTDDVSAEKERYLGLLEKAYERFGDGDYHFISSPGRTEIGGNHTDHQHGHIVAASLDIDNLCCVKASDEHCLFCDPKFPDCEIFIDDLEMKELEKNTSASLIRGIASRLNELGYNIGGFEAVCDSEVLIGSGISSSACFEVMLVEIFNCLYNGSAITPEERALVSQYAENNFFGKPCGLMDQLAISVGGLVAVDFKDPQAPVIDSYDLDLSDYGYQLLLVNTKGDHAELTGEYAAITSEIKEVARDMDVEFLREKSPDYFFANMKKIRSDVANDRAILRSFHFYNEDLRARKERDAIARKDIDTLLSLINESGRSSYMYLQNVYPSSQPKIQPCAIGLALSDYILSGQGASRIHGGGFAGTIQAVVPNELLDSYKLVISSIFDDDSILPVKIRPFGTRTII